MSVEDDLRRERGLAPPIAGLIAEAAKGVGVHELLTGDSPVAREARAKFIVTLRDRGWPDSSIRLHVGISERWLPIRARGKVSKSGEYRVAIPPRPATKPAPVSTSESVARLELRAKGGNAVETGQSGDVPPPGQRTWREAIVPIQIVDAGEGDMRGKLVTLPYFEKAYPAEVGASESVVEGGGARSGGANAASPRLPSHEDRGGSVAVGSSRGATPREASLASPSPADSDALFDGRAERALKNRPFERFVPTDRGEKTSEGDRIAASRVAGPAEGSEKAHLPPAEASAEPVSTSGRSAQGTTDGEGMGAHYPPPQDVDRRRWEFHTSSAGEPEEPTTFAPVPPMLEPAIVPEFSDRCDIDVRSATPSAGFEFDAEPYMRGLKPICIDVLPMAAGGPLVMRANVCPTPNCTGPGQGIEGAACKSLGLFRDSLDRPVCGPCLKGFSVPRGSGVDGVIRANQEARRQASDEAQAWAKKWRSQRGAPELMGVFEEIESLGAYAPGGKRAAAE